MTKVGLIRVRFFRDESRSNPKTSVDDQLQENLQHIVDQGSTIISIQQTYTKHASPENMDTYVKWAEFLILTSYETES